MQEELYSQVAESLLEKYNFIDPEMCEPCSRNFPVYFSSQTYRTRLFPLKQHLEIITEEKKHVVMMTEEILFKTNLAQSIFKNILKSTISIRHFKNIN